MSLNSSRRSSRRGSSSNSGLLDDELLGLHEEFLRYCGPDGCVDIKDLRVILETLNPKMADAEQIITSADGSGRFSMLEFLAVALLAWEAYQRGYITFKLLDEEGYGNISREELVFGLTRLNGGRVPFQDSIDLMMKEADEKNGGYMTIRDLVHATIPMLTNSEDRLYALADMDAHPLNAVIRARSLGYSAEESVESYARDLCAQHGDQQQQQQQLFVSPSDCSTTASPPESVRQTPCGSNAGDWEDRDSVGDKDERPPCLETIDRKNLRMAFDHMDVNKDGYLSWQELRLVLRGRLTDSELSTWVRCEQVSRDKDRFVSYREFLTMVQV